MNVRLYICTFFYKGNLVIYDDIDKPGGHYAPEIDRQRKYCMISLTCIILKRQRLLEAE